MRNGSVVIMALLVAVLAQAETGSDMHGFRLIEQRFVNEVNADCYLFQHERSGARLLKIANNDPNKTFCISFKTVTESDGGTPHILEHSVLNGSSNFPVKSPFDVLSKGSLNTFLNAMTGSDITLYPVSSMNDKDFHTLMNVYLDAVFNPLIYEDRRIFEQEGWHRELTAPDAPVHYKGVVYNEMKGAFSSPTREWGYRVDQLLFPDSPYRFCSGGYPRKIPTLNYETFLAFHRKYYHPSNAYIFLYGDGDLNDELAFLDKNYLSHYQQPETKVSIPLQPPFENMQTATGLYAAAEHAEITDNSYLSLSFVYGLSSDRELVLGLQLLTRILFNNESSPVRLALQEAGIGQDVSAWVDDLKQNVIHIRVQNANPDQAEAFRNVVFKTLQTLQASGLDAAAVTSAYNRMAFGLREGNTPQKGLAYNRQALSSWFWTDDPFPGLEYEKSLTALQKDLSKRYLENLISRVFLTNPHSLLFTLNPKPGLEAEHQQQIEAELAEYKQQLSPAERDSLVNYTRQLIDYQKSEDSPEQLASIPLLSLADISPQVSWYPLHEFERAGIPVLHYKTFTNNISYLKFFFDLRTLNEEQLPYAKLLAVLLGSLATERYSFAELDNALNTYLGGFSTYLSSYSENDDDALLRPFFVVSLKVFSDDQARAFKLVREILTATDFTDSERIRDLLVRHQSRLSASVHRDGRGYATKRLLSYFTRSGQFNERISGLAYYDFINDLLEQLDGQEEKLIQELQKTSELLFTRSHLLAAVTCDAPALRPYKRALRRFSRKLPISSVKGLQSWTLQPSKKNEGLLAASKVQYVLQGADLKSLGYDWNGHFLVLNQIVSREWLKNQVRVIGGAYGGYSRFDRRGMAYFASYRDPNLTETLANYAHTPEFLKTLKLDESEMRRFIIGTISRLDRPRTPSQEGNIAVSRYFTKRTPEQLLAERQEILATTLKDIKTFAPMIEDLLKHSAVCVYGNEEKLKANQDLFDTLIPLK